MVILQNEYLQVKIEDIGAQPVSIRDLKNDRELLWKGDAIFWSYHDPVLFPFVGTVKDNQYRYHGKTFSIGQHGFARRKAFTLAGQTETSAEYVLEQDEETKEIYPFDFRFTVSQSLLGRSFIIKWKVENPSDDSSMYFSIGAHPAFRVPVNEKEKKNECFVLFPGKDELTYILKDPDGIGAYTQKEYKMELDNGYLQIADHLFDIDTFIFENGQIDEAALCGADRKPYVTLRCKGFPYFGLWTKSDEAPFVCLEPWYGRLDDTDFSGELPQKSGIIKLNAGEEFKAQYEIEI